MSALASQLSELPAASGVRRGPIGACAGVYEADLEDWQAVQELRTTKGYTWREAQEHVDNLLGLTRSIKNDKFRYHYSRRCFCWSEDLRR